MKMQRTFLMAAIAAAMALPAQSAWLHRDARVDRATYYEPGPAVRSSPNAIHSGANNPADEALADRVADALRADPVLTGTTVTVAANHGQVMLSGNAPDFTRAQRVERIAVAIAGRANVSGQIDAAGG
jgi:osmotically-inducible protein OsmY